MHNQTSIRLDLWLTMVAAQLLPVWLLYKTQMPLGLKVTVLFLLGLGAM